ncbi:MAG: ribulose-phosphate 3-epimerase [Clostridia bacterium]|nr:ribulose-phosphate 3-epimerase [Clostridia bacterium]
MQTPMLSPSMMCAPLESLPQLLQTFSDEKIEMLHIDVMDGVFVDNLCLGTDYCRSLRRLTSIPLDLHLMITEPEHKLAWFDIQPGEFVSVHVESSVHLQRTFAMIRALGAHPAAALNPATPLSVLDYCLDEIDGILLMTVNPGFAGQKMIPSMIDKISDCRRYLVQHGYPEMPIEVDGNVSFENGVRMREAGADIFVAGTSSVFAPGRTEDNIRRFRSALYSASRR